MQVVKSNDIYIPWHSGSNAPNFAPVTYLFTYLLTYLLVLAQSRREGGAAHRSDAAWNFDFGAPGRPTQHRQARRLPQLLAQCAPSVPR